MAYRKVDEKSLSAVADSIREKGGTTGALAFPDGFVSAVQAIQAERRTAALRVSLNGLRPM